MSEAAPQQSTPSPESRSANLIAFRGPLQTRDNEVIEHWRLASPAAHAQAMIELSRYAERMTAQTGITKDATDMFPGFPKIRSLPDSRHKLAAK